MNAGLNDSLEQLLTDQWQEITRSVLAETGLQRDQMFAGEIDRLFDSPGLRRRYVRRHGLTIDGFAELLWNRGATLRRPDCRETLDLLDSLQLGSCLARKIVTIARELDRQAAAGDAIETRRKTRLRLWECEACRQKIRAATDELTAMHRHENPDTGDVELVPFVLITPTLDKTARGGAVPF